MDAFLGTVTKQAMNYAIRSGVALTASYAIKQSTKLLDTAPKSTARDELIPLQQKLNHKIRIVSPAIDMIELIAARGNTSLESAMLLTKELRLDLQDLNQRLTNAVSTSKGYKTGSARQRATIEAESEQELAVIVFETKRLISRIDDAIPLINLALTTSGAKLSTTLPSTISPSRLLQSSTFLTAGDAQYAASLDGVTQIGPTFVLTVYMLFAGHNRPETEEELRSTTWKEVIHKAQVRIRRVPLDLVTETGSGSQAMQAYQIKSPHKSNQTQFDVDHRAEFREHEYAYQLTIVEDCDDGRHHDLEEEGRPTQFDDVSLAGVRETIPIHEISKIFYADTSKVLNIGMDAEANHPVLLLRRDVNAEPPRRMVERKDVDSSINPDLLNGTKDNGKPQTTEEQEYVGRDSSHRKQDPYRLPSSLDPEWIAFEVYQDTFDSDSESETFEDATGDLNPTSNGSSTSLAVSISDLQISGDTPRALHTQQTSPNTQVASPWTPKIQTSLSMLELLLRLTSLQQFQQQSHLTITDELLNFFLEESSSTGAGGDETHRQTTRNEARYRIGWDPYNESPVKRRGEDYLDQQIRSDGQSPSASSEYALTPTRSYHDGATVTPRGSGPRISRTQSPATKSPTMSTRAQFQSISGTPLRSSSSATP